MRRSALRVLACPNCGGELDVEKNDDTEILNGALLCRPEGLVFPIVEGVPMLVRPNSVERLEAFETSYARTWALDGWGCGSEAYLLNLPWKDITRRRSGEWGVKSRSMEALFRLLGPTGPGKVIDLGCGIGWLSYHMARRGSEVYAVDIVRDETVGLGAAAVYLRSGPYFERVWGDFANLPFKSSSVDAIVCNASLHYSSDLGLTLKEIARVVNTSGLLVVFNSPVQGDEGSAGRSERDFRARLRRIGASEGVTSSYHHFVRHQLEKAIRETFGSVHEQWFDPGRGFLWFRQAKALVLRMELASFPLLYATKRDAGGV